MLVDALLVLGPDDVREPIQVADDVVEDALFDGVRIVGGRAARTARAACSARAGGGRRGRKLALEVEIEDLVGIGVWQNDLTGAAQERWPVLATRVP